MQCRWPVSDDFPCCSSFFVLLLCFAFVLLCLFFCCSVFVSCSSAFFNYLLLCFVLQLLMCFLAAPALFPCFAADLFFLVLLLCFCSCCSDFTMLCHKDFPIPNQHKNNTKINIFIYAFKFKEAQHIKTLVAKSRYQTFIRQDISIRPIRDPCFFDLGTPLIQITARGRDLF